jgi:hypothetical protein
MREATEKFSAEQRAKLVVPESERNKPIVMNQEPPKSAECPECQHPRNLRHGSADNAGNVKSVCGGCGKVLVDIHAPAPPAAEKPITCLLDMANSGIKLGPPAALPASEVPMKRLEAFLTESGYTEKATMWAEEILVAARADFAELRKADAERIAEMERAVHGAEMMSERIAALAELRKADTATIAELRGIVETLRGDVAAAKKEADTNAQAARELARVRELDRLRHVRNPMSWTTAEQQEWHALIAGDDGKEGG